MHMHIVRKPEYTRKFKDDQGRVKRQAAFFRVFKYDDFAKKEIEINLADTTQVKKFKWTVHIANKKAAWYEYTLLKGNLLLGEDNSYANQGVDLRNKDYQDEKRQLFVQGEGAPLMPLQAGTNPVRNNDGPIDKFFTLTPTQYFLLKQWADGKFKASEATEKAVLQPRDSESVGNCVGWPMSPGIEVTWSMFNPNLYVQPYHIKHRLQNGQKHNDYKTRGLDPSRDETTIVWWFMAAVKYARYVAQEKNETQVVTMLSQALESTSVKEVQKHLAAARQKAQAEELREVIDAAASDCEHSDIGRLVQIALGFSHA